MGVPPTDSGHVHLIEASIEKALTEAYEKGIKGAAITPFLLKKVQEYSGGVSLDVNVALIKKNAEVGAKLAVNFNKMLQE